jgi:REP element-mobilizing transposase RayT
MAEFPAAYLITFRTYGSWLHGDERGSVAFRRNEFGTPKIAPNPTRVALNRLSMRWPQQSLDTPARTIVNQTIREVCEHRGWQLHALAIRTEHIHVVVSAELPPERLLRDFKAWCTRRMRDAGLLPPEQKLWSHHGSTVYLWDERAIADAWVYVEHGQGEPLP